MRWVGAHVYLPAAGVLAAVTLVAVVLRFRRSSGLERQQLKWLGLPLALIPLALVAVGLGSLVGPRAMNAAGDLVWISGELLLPALVAVAITRYRLYDLDLVVNRTVVYGLLCLVLAATYVAAVLLVGRLVRAGLAGSGSGRALHPGSPVVVAAATLATASLVRPARRAVQDLVDRAFARRAWAADRILDRATDRARSQRLDAAGLQTALREALGDPGATLVLWLRDRSAAVGVDGGPPPPARPGDVEVALSQAAPGPALVRVGPEAARDRRLLEAVVQASGLAAATVRLQVELDDRVAEVARSRARLVEAADATRRRVERDLHDGAQQHLVGLALHVRLAARRTGDPFLATVERELCRATDELRELARGLHPAALDQGLEPALRVVVARLPLPVALQVEPVRLAGAAELTAYFVACEALTNACRHADPQTLSVIGRAESGGYRLSVVDDGRGGADEARGSGLAGLRDRALALGGALDVTRSPGRRYVGLGVAAGRRLDRRAVVHLALAEDSTLLREGLVHVFEGAGHVVSVARNGAELDGLVARAADFDVAVLDVRMPPTWTDEGSRAALALRDVVGRPGVLLLSAYVDTGTALRLLDDHPDGFGYLLKDRVVEVDDLLDAVDRVAAGGFVIDPEVVRQLVGGHAGDRVLGRLTARERDILALVAEGLSNRAIAARLRVTGKTVENHVSSIFAKLDLPDQPGDHRRVKAALLFLGHAPRPGAVGIAP